MNRAFCVIFCVVFLHVIDRTTRASPEKTEKRRKRTIRVISTCTFFSLRTRIRDSQATSQRSCDFSFPQDPELYPHRQRPRGGDFRPVVRVQVLLPPQRHFSAPDVTRIQISVKKSSRAAFPSNFSRLSSTRRDRSTFYALFILFWKDRGPKTLF